MLLPNQHDYKLKKHQELEKRLLDLFVGNKSSTEIISKLEPLLNEMKLINGFKNEISTAQLQPISDLKLLEKFRKYQEELVNICNAKTPVINLELFTDFANSFAKYFSEPEQNYDYAELENCVGVFSSQSQEIPITFTNGKKTVITSHNFNLSEFTRPELIELLRVLDVIVKDSRYDYLRSEIVDQIDSISTVSKTSSEK